MISETVARSPIRFRATHLFVRVLAVASVSHFVLGSYSHRYYEATRFTDPDVELLFGLWLLASTIVLPLVVGLEFLWVYAGTMHLNVKRERNSIILDGCFAAAWFVTAWGLAVYGIFHFVPL